MRNLKRTLSLVLAAVMLVGMMVVGASAASSDFVDGNEITYAEAAEVMTALGVFEGTDKGAFDPTGILTREQAAAIICRMLLGDDAENLTTNSTVFSDVAADRWSAGYIGYCAQQNILAGTGNGTFNPEGELTGLAFAKMLLVALGYDPAIEQYVGNDWAVNVAADAVDAGIAVSGVIMADAMIREQAAQMAYQTLEADMVRYASRGTTIQQPDGSTIIVGNTAAEPVSKTDSDYAGDSNDDTQQFCERYFADLKKVNGEDDFARPASQWKLKNDIIGTYPAEADGTFTTAVDKGDLYDVIGRTVYNDITASKPTDFSVYVDGDPVSSPDVADYFVNNETDDAKGTAKGVLTQVFVDSTEKTAVVSLIDTGVAKVTKVTEDSTKGNYEVTVSFKTKVQKADGTKLTPDTKFTTDVKFAKDDVVVYTASADSKEIETMAVAKTVAGKVSAQKDADYSSIDGTKYAYNYAYTGAALIGNGLYNLEDSKAEANPSVDKDATLYLDTYGYAVAFEGKTDTAEDYLFVKAIDTAYGDVSAKVVFYDGTQKTIDIDQVNDGDAVAYVKDGSGATGLPSTTNHVVKGDTVYKYTAGSSDYDLTYVAPMDAKTGVTISNKNPSIAGTNIVTDSQTVFVDVENNKTWTGYKNVTNKSNANVIAIKNSDNVAEIVFLYGSNMTSQANDDDFVILKGTGMEAVKDANKKTVYKFTDAYDVDGNKIDNLYAASKMSLVKGLYLIKNYNSDDYVTDMHLCTAVVNGTVNGTTYTTAGVSADTYALSAKNGVLKLNQKIDLNGATGTQTKNEKQTFAYDDKTTIIVIEQKESGDVDSIRMGDISDIETFDDAKGADNKDMTGVYVITVDDDSDATPLATSILVIIPNVK